MVPVEVVPSPQSTVATKSPAVLLRFESVKVASVRLFSGTSGSALKGEPPVALRLSCSPTATVPDGAIVALSVVRVIVTTSVKRRSWAQVGGVGDWPVNDPQAPDTTRLVVAPSPQSIVAG